MTSGGAFTLHLQELFSFSRIFILNRTCAFRHQQTTSPEFSPKKTLKTPLSFPKDFFSRGTQTKDSIAFLATSLFAQTTGVNRRRKKKKKQKGPVHRIPVIRGPIGILFRLCPQQRSLHHFDYLIYAY